MKLGFVGTGAIAEALVTGLLRDPVPGLSIVLSPRGEEVSARLAARFSETVAVAAGNQAVVNACDVVVLAVRPQIAGNVLPGLAFREDQTVVSLIAMLTLDRLSRLVAPAERIVRAIPLPSAAEGRSPTALMPPDEDVKTLFARVGTVTEVADPAAFDGLAAASGIMATHFAMAATVSEWLEKNGVPRREARNYVGGILSGLARTADRACDQGFAALVGDHETPGGLNEQLRLYIEGRGALAALGAGLDALHDRIRRGG